MAGGGSKSSGEQVTTTKLDPAAEKFRNEMYRQAQGVSGTLGATPGLDPMTQQANATISGLLGGDPAVLRRFMDPYQDQVIGGLGQQYDRLRAQAGMQTNDAAMGAGAFGGSRHGIAQGTRLGEIDRAQGGQVAGLLSQGFNDALNRAQGLAGQAAGMGAYNRDVSVQQNDDPIKRLNVLLSAMGGAPTGSSQSTPLYSNPFNGALGGAMQGAQLGALVPGIGTGIGAAAGGLIGLFG